MLAFNWQLLRTNREDFQKNFKQKVLGMTVLTEYNNQTYRVDDVDFDINPMTTFKKRDQDVTIRDYYAEVSKLAFFRFV